MRDESVCAAVAHYLRALSLIDDNELVVGVDVSNHYGSEFIVEIENEVD